LLEHFPFTPVHRLVSRGDEVVGALVWRELIEEASCGLPESLLGAGCSLAQECLQLRKGVLDRFVMMPLNDRFLLKFGLMAGGGLPGYPRVSPAKCIVSPPEPAGL
jgi:hypothetical protein